MKKLLSFIIAIELIGLLYSYQYPITNYIVSNVKLINFSVENNEYAKNITGFPVELTDDFYVENKEQIYDVILTIVNSGNSTGQFYCSYEYKTCLDDIDDLNNNDKYFELIDNIVHPFNEFRNISFTILPYGIVNVKILKLYSDQEIASINTEVDNIYNNIINNNMTIREKILAAHDYIVDNTSYDTENANLNDYDATLTMSKANYALFTHKGICGSYTDTMAIFLSRMGVENYKISSELHVWNYVVLDNYYHIDTTWDDPVNSKNENMMTHQYFLVTSDQLLNLDTTQHTYNADLYKK